MNNTAQQQNQTAMSDKEYMNDLLSSQKQICSNYDTFACECVNNNLRNEMMAILNDEHQIQYDLFSEMQKRGWYQTKPADANEMTQTRQKFQNMKPL